MANYLRGLELAKQEKYAEADRIFDRLSPGFARFWPGYYAQGVTKLKLGQYAQAETSLGKFRAHNPDDTKAAQLIATAALKPAGGIAGDRLPQTIRRQDRRRMPQHWRFSGTPIWRTISRTSPCSSSKKLPLSIPDNPTIKTQVGISEIDAGHGEQGFATLEQVFGTEAGAPIAGPALVISELRAQRLDKAAEVASALIKRDAKNPVYHTLLGIVRAAQKDYPGAESAFRAGARDQPGPS